MTTARRPNNVARLLVECLEHEGVEYVFGVPGEEKHRNLATVALHMPVAPVVNFHR